jgi:hypothetical protein
MSHDLRFKHPFSCIISSPSGSRMSSISLQFLQNLDTLCTEPIFDGGNLWCYGDKNAIPSQQLASVNVGRKVRFHEGVPENFINKMCRLCLIDDMLNEVYSKQVCHLFTKGSHQRNSDNAKSASPGTILQRHISKCQIFGPLKKRQRQTSIFPSGQKGILREKCQSVRGVSRLDQATARLSRVRSFARYGRPAMVTNPHIPRTISALLYAPVSDETHKVQLSRSTAA